MFYIYKNLNLFLIYFLAELMAFPDNYLLYEHIKEPTNKPARKDTYLFGKYYPNNYDGDGDGDDDMIIIIIIIIITIIIFNI